MNILFFRYGLFRIKMISYTILTCNYSIHHDCLLFPIGYQGCFQYHSVPTLNERNTSSNSMTVEKCKRFCQQEDVQFYGIEVIILIKSHTPFSFLAGNLYLVIYCFYDISNVINVGSQNPAIICNGFRKTTVIY